ncbi:MAG TPA: hypothetical protein DCY04_03115 [Eubacterium sp.]|jgi:hypothetical protein|nr:hypothetical protein [Eubacterium sp.]
MKKKSFTDKAKNWFEKYLNGWKGTISIFLVITMMPITSLALTFEEASRYQSAMEMMNEVVDSSAFSSIAEYDSYLDNRFALLATSQESDINNNFKGYLTDNVSAMGKSVTVNNKKITGKYSLSDQEVLKQQVLENAEISVTTRLISDVADVNELLDTLKENLKLDELDKMVGQVTDAMDLTSSVVEAVKNVKSTYDKAVEYKTACDEYNASYNDSETGFIKKVINLAEKLKMAQDNLGDEDDPSTVYNNTDVITAITEANNAAKVYKEKTDSLATKEKEMQESLTGLLGTLKSIADNVHKNKDNIEDGDLAAQCTTSTDEWIIAAIDEALTQLNNMVSPDLKDKVNADVTKLQQLSNNLTGFNAKNDISSTTTVDTLQDKYKYVKVESLAIPSNIDSVLSSIQTNLDNKSSNINTEGASNFLDLVGQVMNLSGIYDSSMNAVLTNGVLYNSNVPQNLSTTLLLNSMTNLVNAGNNFVEGIKSKSIFGIVNVLLAIKDVYAAEAQFLGAVVTWIGNSAKNLFAFVSGGFNEMYNNLLLYGYGVYNLSNRVSIDGGKTLYGYSYSKVFSLAGGTYSKSLTGALSNIGNISSNVNGSDTMFKGAEGEYLVIGSNNEIQNQVGTFFNLYMLRFLLDIIPVFKDAQLTSISAAAGPLAWLVKVAAAIVEPMIDSILLVNGRKVYFIKKSIWLSYTGVSSLVQELLSCSGISSAFTDKIKDTIKAADGVAKMKGKLNMDYNEHLMILMAMSVDQTRYLQRLQNVIQMEGLKKYNNSFSLDKSYTMIKAEVDYTLNPMFNVGLTNGGYFNKRAVKYVGY